tara:strand:+ start:163 stop:387 length:225 start_codon:yes stop_codon:yes gene_type:complete
MVVKKKFDSSIELFFVIAPGFEPGTACLEGRCSIQLSYATKSTGGKSIKNVEHQKHLLKIMYLPIKILTILTQL